MWAVVGGGVNGVGPAEEEDDNDAGGAPPAEEAEEAEEEASRFDVKVGRNSTGGWRIAGERSRASPALISLPSLLGCVTWLASYYPHVHFG